MKDNMFVAYDEYDRVPFIYFEDKNTNELTMAEFGEEEAYKASPHLETTVYDPEGGIRAIDTTKLSEQDQDRVYKNFVYDPREKYTNPHLSEVFKGTAWETDFNN